MADVESPFSSLDQVYTAYYGDSDTTTTTDDDDSTNDSEWESPVEYATLDGGWLLYYQDHETNDARRWFLIRNNGGQFEVLNSKGRVEEITKTTSISNYPLFSSEETARSAHEKWLGDNPNPDNPDDTESSEWSEWSKVREAAPWWIFARSHKTEDRVELLARAEIDDGSTVYLGKNGQVQDDAHIFTSVDALSKALQAYFQRVQDGDVPEDRRPNGASPPTPGPDVGSGDTPGGDTLAKIAQAASERPLATAAVGLGAVYALTQTDVAGGIKQ